MNHSLPSTACSHSCSQACGTRCCPVRLPPVRLRESATPCRPWHSMRVSRSDLKSGVPARVSRVRIPPVPCLLSCSRRGARFVWRLQTSIARLARARELAPSARTASAGGGGSSHDVREPAHTRPLYVAAHVTADMRTHARRLAESCEEPAFRSASPIREARGTESALHENFTKLRARPSLRFA
jgi:hypothetical protein